MSVYTPSPETMERLLMAREQHLANEEATILSWIDTQRKKCVKQVQKQYILTGRLEVEPCSIHIGHKNVIDRLRSQGRLDHVDVTSGNNMFNYKITLKNL